MSVYKFKTSMLMKRAPNSCNKGKSFNFRHTIYQVAYGYISFKSYYFYKRLGTQIKICKITIFAVEQSGNGMINTRF